MNRIALLFPELLLLIVPLLFVYFWRGRSPGSAGQFASSFSPSLRWSRRCPWHRWAEGAWTW